MIDPMSSLIQKKLVECLVSKSFSMLIELFGTEIKRIHTLLESNTLADLQAAIDLTRSALTLQNMENRRQHLNNAIMEYTKAIQRLKNHRNATLDITMARFGKALSYYMLDEPSNCAAELQQLQNGVELFHEEIKKYLAGMEKR